MKKTILLLAVVPFLFSSCEHESISSGLDFNITLDPSNTYYAGDPVKFIITGTVDNIVFYSGEFGYEYQYRNRYSLTQEDVTSAILSLDVQHRWGNNSPALEIFMSNTFEGLSGDDGYADRATVAAMYDADAGTLEGFEKIEFDDPGASEGTWLPTIEVDLKELDMLSNFSLAFHWNPPKGTDDTEVRFDRYWINGNVAVDYEGEFDSVSLDLSSLVDVTVMMSEELDPYYKNNSNGSIVVNSANYDIIFNGGTNTAVGHNDCEGWVFTAPQQLYQVSNDQGTVIKNIQNSLSSYEYTWTEAGTYEVVFIGSSVDYLKSESEVKTFTINIIETPIQVN